MIVFHQVIMMHVTWKVSINRNVAECWVSVSLLKRGRAADIYGAQSLSYISIDCSRRGTHCHIIEEYIIWTNLWGPQAMGERRDNIL